MRFRSVKSESDKITKIDKKLKDLAIATGIATTETPKEKAAQLFINEIENINHKGCMRVLKCFLEKALSG